jgi:hypothetical protein
MKKTTSGLQAQANSMAFEAARHARLRSCFCTNGCTLQALARAVAMQTLPQPLSSLTCQCQSQPSFIRGDVGDGDAWCVQHVYTGLHRHLEASHLASQARGCPDTRPFLVCLVSSKQTCKRTTSRQAGLAPAPSAAALTIAPGLNLCKHTVRLLSPPPPLLLLVLSAPCRQHALMLLADTHQQLPGTCRARCWFAGTRLLADDAAPLRCTGGSTRSNMPHLASWRRP